MSMTQVAAFAFNPFAENTYVIYTAEGGECLIIDPGCGNRQEEAKLKEFLDNKKLTPVRLLNTHCHIDHILGNRYIAEAYKLPLEAHREEAAGLRAADVYSSQYGMAPPKSPDIEKYLEEGQEIKLGDTVFKVLFTPGHSPGHVVFYNETEKYLIGGDVLFYQSIGRTDLPGGSYPVLMKSIKEKLMALPDEVKVYSGHGPATTIGHERKHNPYINETAWA